MINKQRARNGKRWRNGVTMIELGFVIAVGAVMALGAYGGYKKIYLPMKGDNAYSQIASVTSALERVKATNGSVYPVASTANISTISMIENELGGAANSRDVANWTYNCSSGSGQTITLTTTAFDDPVIASLAAQKVTNALSPWVATATGNTITATLSNVNCN